VTRWKRQVKANELRWSGDHHLRVGNANFLVTLDPHAWETVDPESDEFVLLKNKGMIERLRRFAPKSVGNIVDLGIFKGGSVALYRELFHRGESSESIGAPIVQRRSIASSLVIR
jgi:hypothetical protein